MRSIHVAAATCLLFIAAIARAQNSAPAADSNHLLASSAPHLGSTARASVLAGLFGPVTLPPDPASTCPAPAASPSSSSGSSGGTMPVSPLPSAPETSSSALPNSPALPAIAMVKPAASRPDSLKRVLFANSVMYGATIFHAFGRQYEVNACIRETGGLKNGVFRSGSYKGQAPGRLTKFYAISLPIDAGVSLLSLLARHKGWRAFEIAAPLSAATAHVTAGAFKFSAGCY